jgi:hypothetical protein
MKSLLTVALLILWCALTGCKSKQAPIARDALVGSYVYKSEDPEAKDSDHNLNHLVLQANGRYDLIEGGSTKAPTETQGSWTIVDAKGSGQEVLLDHAGYPIRVERGEIRLLIDTDIGIWYAKAE